MKIGIQPIHDKCSLAILKNDTLELKEFGVIGTAMFLASLKKQNPVIKIHCDSIKSVVIGFENDIRQLQKYKQYKFVKRRTSINQSVMQVEGTAKAMYDNSAITSNANIIIKHCKELGLVIETISSFSRNKASDFNCDIRELSNPLHMSIPQFRALTGFMGDVISNGCMDAAGLIYG